MIICDLNGPIAQSVEHRADNAGVRGSKPLGPTIFVTEILLCKIFGGVAQLGERVLCKHEVVGSIPITSKILIRINKNFRVCYLRSSVIFFICDNLRILFFDN